MQTRNWKLEIRCLAPELREAWRGAAFGIPRLGVRVAAATAFRSRFIRESCKSRNKQGGGCCHTHSKAFGTTRFR
jgi:hypothetical protein